MGTLEGMKKGNENPFVKGNIEFGSRFNGIQSCDKIGSLDFSAWRMAKANPTTKPTIDTSVVDHSTIGCRLVNGRKNGIVQCGQAGNWGNAHLQILADKITTRKSIPVVGRRATMVQMPTKR